MAPMIWWMYQVLKVKLLVRMKWKICAIYCSCKSECNHVLPLCHITASLAVLCMPVLHWVPSGCSTLPPTAPHSPHCTTSPGAIITVLCTPHCIAYPLLLFPTSLCSPHALAAPCTQVPWLILSSLAVSSPVAPHHSGTWGYGLLWHCRLHCAAMPCSLDRGRKGKLEGAEPGAISSCCSQSDGGGLMAGWEPGGCDLIKLVIVACGPPLGPPWHRRSEVYAIYPFDLFIMFLLKYKRNN